MTNIAEDAQPWVPDASTFGARLALVRHRMGWNQKEAALACGIASQSWRNWEEGRRPQELIDACRRIAAATGTRAMRAAGVPGTPHQLRHRYGTAVLRSSGGNLRVAQELLRHASPATTAWYTLVEDEEKRSAVLALA